MWDKSDRGNPRYWCRRCDVKGFVDELSPEEIEEQKRVYLEQKIKREAERQEWIKQLQQEAYWKGWHDAMSSAARQLWERRGVPSQAQDWLELGYTDSPPGKTDRPALTIPYHSPDDWGTVLNLQWRYLQQENKNKYSQPKGKPLPYYVTDATSTSKNLLVVEGAIKAAVIWWELAVKSDMDYQVVGIPSSTPSAEVMDSVSSIEADKVYIMTDPDTFENKEAERIGAWFDEPLYVWLPGKPDDLIVQHEWSSNDIDTYIRAATHYA